MLGSFFVEGGAASAGWTSYPPLSAVAAYSVLGMVHGVLGWYLTDGDLSQEQLIEQIREMALRGLVATPPTKGPARKTRSRRAAA